MSLPWSVGHTKRRAQSSTGINVPHALPERRNLSSDSILRLMLGRPPGNDNCQKTQIAGDQCVSKTRFSLRWFGPADTSITALSFECWRLSWSVGKLWVGSKDPSQGITRELVWPLARHCLVLPDTCLRLLRHPNMAIAKG